MKKILNTLYVMTEDAYLALDGENVLILKDDAVLGRVPLHTIDGIVAFSYVGASPALMGKCAEMNKQLVFCRPSGKFLARVSGKQYGNILLRREQFRRCEDEQWKAHMTSLVVSAKLYNSASVLRRAVSDHAARVDVDKLNAIEETLRELGKSAFASGDIDSLRGKEGEGASLYFSVFDQLILQQEEDFAFVSRSRRPPFDRINAMLSFGYALLTSLCVSALETVGLDPYAGFFHTDRPGRCSLALDLMEEFRAPLVDRFVLTAINRRMVTKSAFRREENGAVLLTEEGKREFLSLWQKKKRETLMHPYLKETVEWGLVPYVQALLMARYLRGDLNDYPPFFWK